MSDKKPVEIEELEDGRIDIHIDEDWLEQQELEEKEYKEKFMNMFKRAENEEGELDMKKFMQIAIEELG